MKIALVSADSFSLYHHWSGLIKALVDRGEDVDVIGPGSPFDDRLRDIGMRRTLLPFDRFISPRADLALFVRMARHFKRERFDVVHTMEPKANTWGCYAASLARIPRVVSTISGLGFAFSKGKSAKAAVLRSVLGAMYRLAFICADKVWFENPDDLKMMVQSGRISSQKAVLIRSRGIDHNDYSLDRLDMNRISEVRAELDRGERQQLLVTMPVARLIWSKGVREFVGAAQLLAARALPVRFVLVGPIEFDNPEAVPQSWIENHCHLPNLQWIGFREDIREIIAASDAIALPSYYGEGVPRVLLEAMALQKPIITTDNVGCREVIHDRVNGFKLPPRDPAALANAVEELVRIGAEARAAMGRSGRMIVKAEFTQQIVNHKVFTELYGLN